MYIVLSGSLNFGMRRMRSWALSRSSPSSVPFKRFWLLSSWLGSTNTTKPIALGGLVNGTEEALGHPLSRSLLVNSLSRSLKCHCGRQTSYSRTCCWYFWLLQSWFPSPTGCIRRCCVSAEPPDLVDINWCCDCSLAASFEADQGSSLLDQTKATTSLDCSLDSFFLLSNPYWQLPSTLGHQVYGSLPVRDRHPGCTNSPA